MLAFISGLAAVVAVAITYFQWRTAQTKVALEIHAARYAIYHDLRKAVSDFLRDLNFSLEVQGKYMDAQSRARFHFGAEVEQYLESLRRDMIKGHTFNRYGHLQPPPGNADQLVARLDRINAFYEEIDRMFVPYMRLDQRMPLWWRTPLVTKMKSCAIQLKEKCASGVEPELIITDLCRLATEAAGPRHWFGSDTGVYLGRLKRKAS